MLDKNEFKEIRKELKKFEANREDMIKRSRHIIQLSKKIIFALHRNDLSAAKKGVAEIKGSISKLPENSFDTNMRSVAIQEFVEAMTYYFFITENRVPTKKELKVESNEYLLGLCDLSGELVRKAIKSAIEHDFEYVKKIRDLVSEIYSEFLEFDLRNSELRKKSDQIKYALAKLEETLYNIEVKR